MCKEDNTVAHMLTILKQDFPHVMGQISSLRLVLQVQFQSLCNI